jgi:glutamine cyclotransferase
VKKVRIAAVATVLGILLTFGATGQRAVPTSRAEPDGAQPSVATSHGVSTPVPVYGYRVVNEFPHDPDAFTQGLVYLDGELYEGTGLNGRSTLRRVELETGKVVQSVALDAAHFGEGIAVVGDRIYQLTWQTETCFVYDRETFEPLESFAYPTEGWGLTSDGERLIMSDGTSRLYLRDPETFEEIGQVDVRDGDDPVVNLNELEYVEGEIWANVWQTDRIARIDPASGRVTGWIDLTGLLSPVDYEDRPVDVLNGIAHDEATGRVFVTGKLWPKLFEIEVVPPN